MSETTIRRPEGFDPGFNTVETDTVGVQELLAGVRECREKAAEIEKLQQALEDYRLTLAVAYDAARNGGVVLSDEQHLEITQVLPPRRTSPRTNATFTARSTG